MQKTNAAQTLATGDLLVYLFTEMFAQPAKGMLTQAMIAPQSGEKYNLKQVVVQAYLAALMELSNQDAIHLLPIEVRKLLGKETTVRAEIGNVNGAVRSPFQNILLQSISAAQKLAEGRVQEVVIRVVGGRASSKMPWFVAVAPLVAQARQGGWVTTPEKNAGLLKTMFNPTEAITRAAAVPERIATVKAEAEALKSQLAAFEASLGAQAAMLRKEIERGVDECMDHSD